MNEKLIVVDRGKDIAFKDDLIAVESLPYPLVFYPSFYGTFFAFKECTSSKVYYLCSCSRVALENYVSLRVVNEIHENSTLERMYILDSAHFPISFIKWLITNNVPSTNKILEFINYKDKICHECNKVVPKYRYCHEMYGGMFKQTYGWYINKQALEFGIEPITNKILRDICPEEVFDVIQVEPDVFWSKYEKLKSSNIESALILEKEYSSKKRKLWNLIENQVRIKFGFKKVGDAWTNETLLYNLIINIFPNQKIIRHYRPKFLLGLELDIFLPELNIGIEYQGIQHYKSIKHWGGDESLKKCQERDAKKEIICKSYNVDLIFFHYFEVLSKELVEMRLIKYLDSTENT